MFFYAFHHINHSDNADMNASDYNHGARNVRTFIMGSIAYIFTAAFLYSKQYADLISNVFILSALRDWLLAFVLVDVIAMAITFKKYWGFSIVREGREAFVENSH